MDSLIKESLAQVHAKTRTSVPWEPDQAWRQDTYTFTGDEWKIHPTHTDGDGPASRLAVYSWNIDFMLPFPNSRMSIGLNHLQQLVRADAQWESTAAIIYLQECVESDVELITAHPWIRDAFSISDINTSHWQSGHYGTITLVDKRLSIASCFRVHYSHTRMERDVLVVDIRVGSKTVRMCNSHLESLALEPPYRPAQMKLCAEYMREGGIDAAVVAGDFNAIQDFDRTLHDSNGLRDAYLELGGKEDDIRGHTWGQQAAAKLRKQFGTSRMDKVFYCGDFEVDSFENFGADILLEDESEQDDLVKLGFDKPWITDHLGVKAVFKVIGVKATL